MVRNLMALSGKITKDIPPSSGDTGGHYFLQINWNVNSQSQATNKSNITVSLITWTTRSQAGSSYNLGSPTTVSLIVGGTSVPTSNLYLDYRQHRSEADAITLATWTGDVAHATDGTLNLSISGSFNYPGGGTSLVSGTYSVSGTASVTPIARAYTLSISAGANSAITVTRNGSTLSNGATVYYGDALKVYFSVNSGYALGTHTVNGSTFTSGNTHSVTGNVSVVSTASIAAFTLTLEQGSNTTLTVKRNGTTLSSGTTIYYGDVLTITYSASSGYTITQATVNNNNITSGSTYSVTGNTTVKTVATAQPRTLYINQGNNTTITVTRSGEVLRDGDTLAQGDILTIIFTAATGYTLTVHKVNGTTFVSGNTFTVGASDVTVESVAATGASLLQPTNIFPDVIFNNGIVDVESESTFSWQVNGSATMVAYEILFYQNNAASTYIGTTGKTNLAQPFSGRDNRGNPVPFEVVFAQGALITIGLQNGYEYKMIIRQWWSATDYIEQLAASVFHASANPVISGLTEQNQDVTTVTVIYNQAQGIPLNWVRWQVLLNGETEVFDTGILNNSNYLTFRYGDMIPNDGISENMITYDIVFSYETAEGYNGSYTFENLYKLFSQTPFSGSVSTCVQKDGGVLVTWSKQSFADKYVIHRLNANDNSDYQVIAIVDNNTTSITDYSAASSAAYIYYVFARFTQTQNDIVGKASGITQPKFYYWKIIEAHPYEQDENENAYLIDSVHTFRYGVSEGSFSNNNAPNILKNFTPYPAWQADSSNYLSGSVSGYIGTIDVNKTYYDSILQSKRIFALSQTEKDLFLLDPEGNFAKIKVSSPITMNVKTTNIVMQKTMTIPWVEIESAKGLTLLSAESSGSILPTDVTDSTLLNMRGRWF